VAVAARRLNRPVRCVVSRSQGFTTQPYRAPTRHRIRLGASPAGKISAYGHESWELTSRKDNYAVAGTETTTRLYGYGAVFSKVNLLKADRQTPAFMRSPPELPYMFALESALDELAYKLQMDPMELRRVNDARVDPIEGKPFSSRQLMQCFDEASRAFGWSKRTAEPRSMRDGDWLVGWDVQPPSIRPMWVPAAARVRLSATGKVLVQSASHEIGTGVRTVAGQMAADQLGVDFDGVTVQMGDTNLPPAPVSGGSNSTASVCSAVMKACAAIRARLFSAAVGAKASPLAGRHPNELTLKNGAVIAPNGRSQKLAQLFETLGAGCHRGVRRVRSRGRTARFGAEALRRQEHARARHSAQTGDVRLWRRIRRGAHQRAHSRDTRAPPRRRLCGRTNHEHPHCAQSAHGRPHLGNERCAARSDRA
jgi:xanthine dehydrogenase YagR molybdenum-binding subunit